MKNFLLHGLAALVASFIVSVGVAEPPRDEYSIAVKLPPMPEKDEPPVVTAMAVSPDHRWLAASGDDHVIRILDFATLEVVSTLSGHQDWVQSLDFSPDQRYLVSCGNDGQLRTWDSQQQWKTELLTTQPFALTVAKFHPNSDLIYVVGFSELVQAWSLVGRKFIWEHRDVCNDIKAIAIDSSGTYVAWGGRDGRISILDRDEPEIILDRKLHTGRVRGLEFSRDGSILSSVGEDRRLCRYDVLTRDLLMDMRFPSSKWLTVRTIDSVTLGLAGSDNAIHFYSTADGMDMGKLLGHRGSVRVLCVAGDRLVSSGFDTEIRVWDLNTTWQVLDTSPSDSDAQAVSIPK